jgi:tetratricopeptide (TPR) repeat protein
LQKSISSSRFNRTIRFWPIELLACLLLCGVLAGCAQVAVRGSSSLVPHFTGALFSECDPVLARNSLPSSLKMLEGLLRADPGNPRLLEALSMGYTGYAVLFLEDEAPERAERLLRRALGYGLDALGDRGRAVEAASMDPDALSRALQAMRAEDAERLFWAGLAWSGWVRLNLDDPEALAQLNAAKACLRRVIELDGTTFYGMPYAALGSVLSAVPPMLGGDPEEARALFEKAIAGNHGRFLLAKLYFARYYAVRVQDRALFVRLLDEIEQTDPDLLGEVCLLNAAARFQARGLRGQLDDLFL